MYYNIKMIKNIMRNAHNFLEVVVVDLIIFSICDELTIIINKSSKIGVLILICKQKTKTDKYIKANIIVLCG